MQNNNSNKPSEMRNPCRYMSAIEARETLIDDFFGGWNVDDVALFQDFAHLKDPLEGTITDFLGIRTSTHLHPWASHMDATVISEIPIPDDSLRAEAIEYFALLHAIKGNRGAFRMAELGASYAPWACTTAILCERLKLPYSLVAVEASEVLFKQIAPHFIMNGINPSNGSLRLLNAAVSHKRGKLFFPKVSNFGENGGQAVSELPPFNDYVGRTVEHEEVNAITLAEDVLQNDCFDLLHIDVQGAEFDILSPAIEVANKQVRHIFVGTHSRLLEGQLLDLMHRNGWELLRERPTTFNFQRDRENIVGWTTRDGGQFWSNPHFSE